LTDFDEIYTAVTATKLLTKCYLFTYLFFKQRVNNDVINTTLTSFDTVWCELEQRIVDDVIDQWRRRLLACVDAEGGHFEHSL